MQPGPQEGTELLPLCWWELRPTLTSLFEPEATAVVGVVALIERRYGYWKAYIGLASGRTAEEDAAAIAVSGVHVGEPVARALAAPYGPLLEGLEFRAT